MPSSGSNCPTSFEALHSAAAAQISKRKDLAPRDHVLQLGVMVGKLCSCFLAHAPLDSKRTPLDDVPTEEEACETPLFWTTNSDERQVIANGMVQLLAAIVIAAETCQLELGECILKKMELNNKKYPVDLVKGKSGKYTNYSEHTQITKTEGQSTREVHVEHFGTKTVEDITGRIREFATDRLWSRYHTPRSLVLAIVGELGELAELFQWRGDAVRDSGNMMEGWSQDDIDHVGQEFADVTIYLLRLADVCCVDDIAALALASIESY